MKPDAKVGKMDRRPMFYNWYFAQNAGGGTTETVRDQWYQWASIKGTGDSHSQQLGTSLSTAGYEVFIRFDARFDSTTKMVYEGKICTQDSREVVQEGRKTYLRLRYTKTNTFYDLS